MSVDLTELMKRINTMVAQDPATPADGGEDWTLYLKYLNMAQNEWQESYGWASLYKEVNTLTSQSTGLTSISMPSDFRKADGKLKIAGELGEYRYAQINPQDRDLYSDSDNHFYILGSLENYTMVVNPANHGSGASIYYSYWSTAGSLASPTNISLCPDPNFLVQRATAYLWEARDDGRFPQAKAEADKILSRMLESEVTRGHSYDDRVWTREEIKGFRIGRN